LKNKGSYILLFIRKNIPLFVLLFLLILFSSINSNFLNFGNIINILNLTAIYGIMAAGVTFVMIAGGIDLSIGATLALSAAFAIGFQRYFSMTAAVLMGIGVALLIGWINGLLIAKLKINPFIATLGMNIAIYGLVMIYTNNEVIYANNEKYIYFSRGRLFFIDFPIWVLLLVFIIGYLILMKTRYGKMIYAIGGNEYITKLFGINVDRIKIISYMICSFLCALSGIIVSSRINSVLPNLGQNALLIVIGAVVFGGVSLNGGEGNILNSLIAVLIFAILENAFGLMSFPYYLKQYIWGAILIGIIILDRKKHQVYQIE